MAALMGQQKISRAEAAEIRERFAAWPGPSGPFVAAEAQRFSVGRETIRRLLRGETHVQAPTAGAPSQAVAFPWAGTPTPPAPDAAVDAEARRLLANLQNPAGERAVDLFRDELGPAPAPANSGEPS